jgi:putative transposase
MASPEASQLLQLYTKAVPESFFEEISQQERYQFRNGVFTLGVVMWLMIWQRLHRNRTLAAAVQGLLHGQAGTLLKECKRVERGKISARPAGYCQARQKLPKLVASRVMDRLVEQLHSEMQEGWPGLMRPIVLVDGSSLQLQHDKKLMEAYPTSHNQHGDHHWPVLRLVVFHDVYSGLCLRPSWGPMYGKKAVSEQALAEDALGRVPSNAVVLADCNFGIFAFAWAVQQSGRPAILRLTKARAQKIWGSVPQVGINDPVVWHASRWDRSAHPQLPETATVTGRLIVCANPCRPKELLYLFTTLDLGAAEIISMYKLRWNVETDLRSLKRTVDLHQIHSHSVDMVDKEILAAMSAYNLTRAVMCMAARRAKLAPRQLSFSFVQTVVEAALPALSSAATEDEYIRQLNRVLDYAVQGKLPQRTHARSYPRQVWGRGKGYGRPKKK